MSIDSALICHADRIPTAAAVRAAIQSYGHEIVLPEGFEFARRDDGLWRICSLDAEEAGFDYVISDMTDWDADSGLPNGRGDRLLEFGARGDASIKLVAHVQRAICELAGAHGWIDDQLIDPAEMIADAKLTAETWDETAAQLRASLDSHVYPPPPPPPPQSGRIATWWRDDGRWNALGIVVGGIMVLVMIAYKAVVK